MTSPDQHTFLHQLLDKLFDYAGMFPPAALSFERALEESADHSTSLQRPWLIGTDLVLDTAHTRLLATQDLQALGFTAPVSVAALVTEGAIAAVEAAQALEARSSAPACRVSSVEAKVSPETLPTIVKDLAVLTQKSGALIAVEPDLSTPDWQRGLNETITALSRSPLTKRLALKCRCTGPTGIDAEKLSHAIIAASDAGIGFKVTGGLHHPIVEPEIHASPMGFLNVAAAVYLRRALGEAISAAAITALLTNNSAAALSFGHGIRYANFAITPEELQRAKQRGHFSIGSCSIHEPDEDLTRLEFAC